MEAAIFIAKLYGIILLFMAIGMLFNPAYYRKAINDIIQSGTLIFNGALAASAGIAILTFQNTWHTDWTTIITVLGWMAVIKGFYLLVFPMHTSVWKKAFANNTYYYTEVLLLFVFGIYLTMKWFGY